MRTRISLPSLPLPFPQQALSYEPQGVDGWLYPVVAAGSGNGKLLTALVNTLALAAALTALIAWPGGQCVCVCVMRFVKSYEGMLSPTLPPPTNRTSPCLALRR